MRSSSGVVLPNKKTAVRRKKQNYLTHVARQRNEMRPSSGAVLPNKKTAVRRNIRRDSGCLSHVARQRNEMRQLQRRGFLPPAVSCRRDDRAMMTKKEPGEVNFRSRVSRLF